MSASVLLSARGVTFGYGRGDVLRGINLELRSGEFVVLLGPNGAGKSTLLRLLCGLIVPSSGSVLIDGREPRLWSRREAAKRVSLLSHETPLDFPMTVAEFVGLGRFAHHGLLGGETTADREAVERALVSTELASLADRPLSELSAGERQRATVARSVAQGAGAMLLDEPAAYLDLRHRVELHETVARLCSEEGKAALVASHDLHLSAEYGERIVLLHEGRVLADGPPVMVLTESNIKTAYGIEVSCSTDPESGVVRIAPVRRRASGK